MEYTRCTTHDGHGGTCGRLDMSTRVVTTDRNGNPLHEHRVCTQCRESMGLPPHDTAVTPYGDLPLP